MALLDRTTRYTLALDVARELLAASAGWQEWTDTADAAAARGTIFFVESFDQARPNALVTLATSSGTRWTGESDQEFDEETVVGVRIRATVDAGYVDAVADTAAVRTEKLQNAMLAFYENLGAVTEDLEKASAAEVRLTLTGTALQGVWRSGDDERNADNTAAHYLEGTLLLTFRR